MIRMAAIIGLHALSAHSPISPRWDPSLHPPPLPLRVGSIRTLRATPTWQSSLLPSVAPLIFMCMLSHRSRCTRCVICPLDGHMLLCCTNCPYQNKVACDVTCTRYMYVLILGSHTNALCW